MKGDEQMAFTCRPEENHEQILETHLQKTRHRHQTESVVPCPGAI